jgi:hypothetical protein
MILRTSTISFNHLTPTHHFPVKQSSEPGEEAEDELDDNDSSSYNYGSDSEESDSAKVMNYCI